MYRLHSELPKKLEKIVKRKTHNIDIYIEKLYTIFIHNYSGNIYALFFHIHMW